MFTFLTYTRYQQRLSLFIRAPTYRIVNQLLDLTCGKEKSIRILFLRQTCMLYVRTVGTPATKRITFLLSVFIINCLARSISREAHAASADMLQKHGK